MVGRFLKGLNSVYKIASNMISFLNSSVVQCDFNIND